MADDKRKPNDDQDDDRGLTPLEKQFKASHPESWRRMQEERERQKGDRR